MKRTHPTFRCDCTENSAYCIVKYRLLIYLRLVPSRLDLCPCPFARLQMNQYSIMESEMKKASAVLATLVTLLIISSVSSTARADTCYHIFYKCWDFPGLSRMCIETGRIEAPCTTSGGKTRKL